MTTKTPRVAVEDTLNPKQQRFVEEYLTDLNATQAAIRAGYSARSARVTSCRLLAQANIALAIQRRRTQVSERLDVTVERVLKEFARLAFFDPRKLFSEDGRPIPVTDLDDDTAAAIAGLEILEEYEGSGADRTLIGHTKKYKISDKRGSLDSLARYLGMFVDRHEVSGPDGGPIEVESPRERIASRIAGLSARKGEGENTGGSE